MTSSKTGSLHRRIRESSLLSRRKKGNSVLGIEAETRCSLAQKYAYEEVALLLVESDITAVV